MSIFWEVSNIDLTLSHKHFLLEAGVKNRLLPNYAVARRVLVEAKSLLGPTFDPKRIIDAGIGCGAASAAVLDVFGEKQIDWIHGIDPSKSQREAAEAILNKIIVERTNTAATNNTTRVTISETITQVGSKTGEGTFDLALCCKFIPCHVVAMDLPRLIIF